MLWMLLMGLAIPAHAGSAKAACKTGVYGKNVVGWQTAAELLDIERASAKVEMRAPVEHTQSFGLVSLVLHRASIGAASGEYTVLAVLKDEEVIARRVGPGGVARVPPAGRAWWNMMMLMVPESTPPPFEVRVADVLLSKSCSVYVWSDGSVRRQPE